MVCRIEQSEQQPEANAPAPAPQRVTYREYSPEGGVAEAPLAAEIALAITYNGLSQAVMMVSPATWRISFAASASPTTSSATSAKSTTSA